MGKISIFSSQRVHLIVNIFVLTGGEVKIKRAALSVFKFNVFLSSSSTSSIMVSCMDDCLDVKDLFIAPFDDVDTFEAVLLNGQEAISLEISIAFKL